MDGTAARLAGKSQVAWNRNLWQQQHGGSRPPALRPRACSVLLTYLQPVLSFHWDRWDGDVLAEM